MKEKGFTLVELLAIIVLLAIIAVVASPIILNIIENSKKSGFASSVNGIKDAVENDYSGRNFDTNSEYIYENGSLYFVPTTGNREVVPVSGGISDGNGTASVDENGKVKIAIYNGSYCGTMGYNSSASVKVTTCDGVENCKSICQD